MERIETQLPDVVLIKPKRFGDERGFFSETYNHRMLSELGISTTFIQDNQAYSAEKGTLRGLHVQGPPATQSKLVRVVRGAILDVCVDLRHGSPTFGHHLKVELTAEGGQQIYCPKGFAHGILTLLPDTEIAYKVDAYYAPELDLGVRYDDPDLAIDWPFPKDDLILSTKDRNQPRFRDLPRLFHYQQAEVSFRKETLSPPTPSHRTKRSPETDLAQTENR
jgi:dTDP-4-dehydrorhamnose 3,5-epimerase